MKKLQTIRIIASIVPHKQYKSQYNVQRVFHDDGSKKMKYRKFFFVLSGVKGNLEAENSLKRFHEKNFNEF